MIKNRHRLFSFSALKNRCRGWLVCACFISCCLIVGAQPNLVKNPSFEDTTQCVGTHSQFQGYVTNWRGCCGEFNSAICQGFQTGVPVNVFGYRYARTGMAYAGIYMTIVDSAVAHENARDYIEGELISPLIPGWNYCVNFYASQPQLEKYAAPIGFYFSQDTLMFNQYWINLQPDYMDTGLIRLSDTSGWTLVSATFKADGGERYLTIGNHWNDTLTPLRLVNPNASNQHTGAYYWIDDVSVTPMAEARAGNDSTFCLGDSMLVGRLSQPGISYHWSPGNSLSDSTTAFPYAHPQQTTTYTLTITDTSGTYCAGNLIDSVTINVQSCTLPSDTSIVIPALLRGAEIFKIENLPAGSKLEIIDTRGRHVLKNENYRNDFSVVNLSAGTYVYLLRLPDERIMKGKFTVIN